jgi:hypothetical protein
LPFKKRQFEASRREFESLLGSISGDKKERRREQLIRYQIYLTLLLEARDAAAQKALEEFKMMDDTPALYYAQAAWAFQHGNPQQASNWIANAGNLFSAELNREFAGPLTDAGWLNNGASMPSPSPVAIAAATASPTAPASEVSPPVVADTDAARATPTPAEKRQASPIEKEAASVVKEPKRRARDETASRKPENVESPAHRQSRRKNRQRIARAKPVASPVESANQPATSNPPPPAPMAGVTAAPVRDNLGDKVRHLFLRAFGRRTPQSATPSPTEPPQ